MTTVLDYNPLLFHDIIRTWNEVLVADLINEERFTRLVLADENFDPQLTLIAMVEGSFAGFLWGVKRKFPYLERGTEPDRGYIVAMFVKKEYEQRGVGSALLNEIELRMKGLGVKEITLGAYSPNYLFPGVDKNNYRRGLDFFLSNDYHGEHEAVSMHRHLMNYQVPEGVIASKKLLIEEGYTFNNFDLSDAYELMTFLSLNFGSGWKYNVQKALERNDATRTLIVCRNKEKEIVGYCQRAIDTLDDRFGPFGVREDLRSKGLGAVLFHEMLSSMVQKGIHHVYFLWTSGRAQLFYERQGLKPYREYRLLRKNLEDFGV